MCVPSVQDNAEAAADGGGDVAALQRRIGLLEKELADSENTHRLRCAAKAKNNVRRRGLMRALMRASPQWHSC